MTSRAGGLPRGDPRPKKRPPIRLECRRDIARSLYHASLIGLAMAFTVILVAVATTGRLPPSSIVGIFGVFLLALGATSFALIVRPKNPPLQQDRHGSVGGAFVIVGFIALVLGVVGYILNHYTNGWVPDDPLPLILGIILIAVGIMSILLWEFLKNKVLS